MCIKCLTMLALRAFSWFFSLVRGRDRVTPTHNLWLVTARPTSSPFGALADLTLSRIPSQDLAHSLPGHPELPSDLFG